MKILFTQRAANAYASIKNILKRNGVKRQLPDLNKKPSTFLTC